MNTTLAKQALAHTVRDAVERLTESSERDGKVCVSLPVLYPSGGMTSIEVEANRDLVFVSDRGLGYVEAELMNARSQYLRIARETADDFGLSFGASAIIALWVPFTRLEAAMACVANASALAAGRAVRAAAEATQRSNEEEIFDRITSIFGKNVVSRNAEVGGHRAKWEVHNFVRFKNGQEAIFEPMTKHPNSVSSKFLMFSDIRASQKKISLNVVVPSLRSLDEKSRIISDVANVIPSDASDDQIKHFALAG